MPRGQRVEILNTAIKLTTGDRAKNYGDVFQNHLRIAGFWNIILGPKLKAPIRASEVALMMAELKFARMVETPDHADSPVDGAAYTAIAGELALREKVEAYDPVLCVVRLNPDGSPETWDQYIDNMTGDMVIPLDIEDDVCECPDCSPGTTLPAITEMAVSEETGGSGEQEIGTGREALHRGPAIDPEEEEARELKDRLVPRGPFPSD